MATRGRGFHALTELIARLVGHELTVPIAAARLELGSWQGIYLWEHRTAGMRREVLVTLHGESCRRAL